MGKRPDLISRRTAIIGALLSVMIIIMVAGGTVLSAVARMADHANQLDDGRSRQTMAGAIETFRNQLGATLNDYAAWDDAVANVYDPNGESWMVGNLGDMTADSALFDVAIVLDTNRKVLMAYRHGKPMTDSVDSFFGPSLWTLYEAVRDAAKTDPQQATGFVKSKDGVSAAGVALIRMKSGALDKPADQRRLLIFSRNIDDKVAALGKTYVIDGLSLVRTGAPTGNYIAIQDADGKHLDYLAWPSRAPGDDSYHEVSAAVYSAMALFGFLLATIMAIGLTEVIRLRSDEEKARRLSLTDRLSGLLNRAGLYRELELLIAQARSERSDVALLYLDLDGFKDVNDTYGHGCGDDLIRSVAAGLGYLIPPHAKLARLGGDEFAIAFCVKNAEAPAMQLASMVLEFFEAPFSIGERLVKVGTSIGFAASQIGVVDMEELVRRADVAMYKAKANGRGCVLAYDMSMDQDRTMMLEMQQRLSTAMENGDISVTYQPVVDAATLVVTSVEAGLHWTMPGRGVIAPEIFIPIAEKSGLIEPLGMFLLENACQQAAAWPGIEIAVSISPVQLKNPSFVSDVASCLRQTGMDPSHLVLDLSESYLIQNPRKARQSFEALRALGVKILLNDFGKGFSSLGLLRQYKLDLLKFDRSIVSEIDVNEEARSILQATASLARSLGITVIAGGVEREQQAVILHLSGCNALQGSLFGRPAAPSVIDKLLADEDQPALSQSA